MTHYDEDCSSLLLALADLQASTALHQGQDLGHQET